MERTLKPHKSWSLIALLFLVSAVTALFPTAAAARQRASGKTEEIAGIVTQISATSLTIRTATADRSVHLTAATVIRVDDQPASVTTIATGDKVEAHSQKETDGTFTALVIEVQSHSSSELSGTVRSITATSLTVTTTTGDVVLTLTSATHFFINGRSVAAADVHVGDRVEVEGREQTDKTLTALVVKVKNESLHIRGVIVSATATSITVKTTMGDVVVGLTPSTLIRRGGKTAGASLLVAGSRVEISAVLNPDHSLTAVTIDLELSDALAEIEGAVTEVGTDHIRVHTRSGDNISVAVNTDTVIRRSDVRVGLADIKVGDRISVDARQNADGSYTALRIEVETEHGGNDGGNGSHSAELSGVIASATTTSITVTSNGNTVVVKITSATIIRRGSTTLTTADLKTGNHVEVKGVAASDGSVTATSIQVEDTAGDNHTETVEYSGTVTAVSSTSVTVTSEGHAVAAAVTSVTTVTKSSHAAGSIADVNVGQRVEIHATRASDGTLTATQIAIEDH